MIDSHFDEDNKVDISIVMDPQIKDGRMNRASDAFLHHIPNLVPSNILGYLNH